MFRPHIDETRSETASAHGTKWGCPDFREAADPNDFGTGPTNGFGQTKRRGRGPLHAGDARNAAQPFNCVEADAVVAQIKHDRETIARFDHALEIGNDAG